jgi:hypothetical protein
LGTPSLLYCSRRESWGQEEGAIQRGGAGGEQERVEGELWVSGMVLVVESEATTEFKAQGLWMVLGDHKVRKSAEVLPLLTWSAHILASICISTSLAYCLGSSLGSLDSLATHCLSLPRTSIPDSTFIL